MKLRYGLNPEREATATVDDVGSPVRVVAGSPSYVNLLDALNAWQLVRDAWMALGTVVATSFKHVSPAGVATAGPLDAVMSGLWNPSGRELSPAASAYVRARDCDPKSSFGDFVAVSEPVDTSLAEVLRGVVSDGIIAPGYESGVVEVLAAKKNGTYLVLEVERGFGPPPWESRDVFGVRLTQTTTNIPLTRAVLAGSAERQIADAAADDLLLALVTARYTQSNTVTFVRAGMVIGIGAGQQSRVDCTRLAGAKLDTWWLRRHPKVRSLPFADTVRRQDRVNWQIRHIEGDMDDREIDRFNAAITTTPEALTADDKKAWIEQLDHVVLASDGYIPFRDNIDQAARHGVRYIAEPGGSTRNHDVELACREHGISHLQTGIRLFHH